MIKYLLPILLLCNSAHALTLPSKVRTIYSYSCDFNFLSGSGVSPNSVSCQDGMSLALYKASYTHYLYQQDSSNNNFSNQEIGTHYYQQPICGLQIAQLECPANNPTPVFALSERAEGNFKISITFSPAFQGSKAAAVVYGYAASADAYGQCPDGLMAIRPYTVQMPTLPNTTLINSSSTFNDTVFAPAYGRVPT